MGKYTKEEAIKIVVSCAERYQKDMEERSFLMICLDKHRQIVSYEFTFHSWNFLHLTGLKLHGTSKEAGIPSQAADFYQKCLSHRLSSRDFDFSEDGTTHMKLDVLPRLICKNLSANMVGDYDGSKPKLYTEKLAGSAKAVIGFVTDDMSGKYVPNTILKADLREHVHRYVRVIAVYRKRISAERYEELTYQANKFDWQHIDYPEEYQYLLHLAECPQTV